VYGEPGKEAAWICRWFQRPPAAISPRVLTASGHHLH